MSTSQYTRKEKQAQLNEEAYFSSSSRPADLIRKCYFLNQDQAGLLIAFENQNNRFGVLISLSEGFNLGWKECQCIAGVMRAFRVGETVNANTFVSKLNDLSPKYGAVKHCDPGEIPDKFNRFALLHPPRGTVNGTVTDHISVLKLHVDDDQDIYFDATVNEGTRYVVLLITAKKSPRLSHLECKAFIDILYVLETGDKMSYQRFMTYGRQLHQKYNNVTPKLLHEGIHCLVVRPTSVENPAPLPEVFKDVNSTPGRQEAKKPSNSTHPRYHGIEISEQLKISGQAQLYKGRMNGKDVAVKVFTKNEDDENDYGFRSELRMLLHMTRHKNIVKVLDIFEVPKPAIVMPFIKGHDLSDYLAENGRLGAEEGLSMAVGIAEGLCHLHIQGIVHRDLKTGNIMRRADGVPVIIDLGLSSVVRRMQKRSDEEETTVEASVAMLTSKLQGSLHINETNGAKGTPFWMAPEMITSRTWSDRTDVYAFGIILWEIFSGKTPFCDFPIASLNLLLLAIASGLRPSLSEVEHADERIKGLIEKCWAQEPKDRPSMQKVLDELRSNDPRLMFQAVDDDGDGKLSFAEFVRFAERYCGNLSNDQMLALFQAVDDDGSGTIEVDEFENFWSQVGRAGLEAAVATRLSRRPHALGRGGAASGASTRGRQEHPILRPDFFML